MMTRTSPLGRRERPFPRRAPETLARLKDEVRRLERATTPEAGPAVALGIADVDRHLPWGGLPRGALHEVIADDPGAGVGFTAMLAARLAKAADNGMVLWCEGARTLDAGALYAPGLARFGLAPERVIAVRARTDRDALWALEEGLGADLAAVVGEVGRVSLTESRRLQLAAEAAGTPALLVRPGAAAEMPGAALTRWRLAALPGAVEPGIPGVGRARWRAELFRCRGGTAATWEMEWRDETGDLALAAPLRDRPHRAEPARLAG
jgi:protein ImuA